MSQPELIVYDDAEQLAAGAAERIAQAAVESIAARGRFTLCLTGGSTPKRTYALLAGLKGAAAVDWSKTFLFFGDERFVPPDDDRSNYKMVRESLLQNAPIAEDHVFAVPTHFCKPPEAAEKFSLTLGEHVLEKMRGHLLQHAAEDYARTLKTFFLGAGRAFPEFDLVLLGLGDDGHTASLFPGAAALWVEDRLATTSPPGLLPPPVDRVTLTFPVFNAARQVMFLVSGANKAQAFADVYQGRSSTSVRPAAGIHPADGRLVWLVDRAATGLLTIA